MVTMAQSAANWRNTRTHALLANVPVAYCDQHEDVMRLPRRRGNDTNDHVRQYSNSNSNNVIIPQDIHLWCITTLKTANINTLQDTKKNKKSIDRYKTQY